MRGHPSVTNSAGLCWQTGPEAVYEASVLGDQHVAILGAGPTGLGAAHRLLELGHQNFTIFEASDRVGGLACSHTDEAGFVWDMGGHVQFSHYRYFQDLMDELMADEWLSHTRVASICIADRFVDYPLQHHLQQLPEPLKRRCEQGLADIADSPPPPPQNFRQWLVAQFGRGLAEIFMLPYNFKVWAYPPEQLSYRWIGERVAQLPKSVVGEGKIGATDEADESALPWGPNRRFRFPARGGTGEIWRRLAARLPAARLRLRQRVKSVCSERRELTFVDGTRVHYDRLVSTIPLDQLVACSNIQALAPFTEQLRYSSVHVIGVGLRGQPPPHIAKQCWMYFPDDNCPFYRATVFSNYSPHNVPDASRYWSLMLEVSESSAKPVDETTLEARVIDGLLANRLISSRDAIHHLWRTRLEYGYPTPTLERDAVLDAVLPRLEEHHIYSRGRFGAWKYEVSNQDHSFMQGVEVADRMLRGSRELTLNDSAFVNAPGLRQHPYATAVHRPPATDSDAS